MIDIRTEHLLPVKDVPGYLESRGIGKRVTLRSVNRWIQRGSDGAKLEAIRIGGMAVTSREALQRWVEAQSRSVGPEQGPAPVDPMENRSPPGKSPG